MEHPREIEWIDLANGAVGADRAEALRQHAAQCEACRTLFEQAQRMNAALGTLDATDIGADLTAGVLAGVDDSDHAIAGSIRPFVWKLAASVVIAGSVGWAVGVTRRGEAPPVNVESVRADLDLPTLQVDSSAGLAELIFTLPTDATVEEGVAG